MKKYLITGGSGFIGSSLVNKLLSNNHFVRVLDDQSRGNRLQISNNNHFEFIAGDVRNINTVNQACQNIDSVVHLAFVNGTKYFYEKPELVLEVGVKGMINVLDAGKKNHVKELFLASSSEVYQTPPVFPTPENVPLSIPDLYNPRYSYAGGKIISELLTLYNGSKIFEKIVIFRPHNVYGPQMGYEHVIPELISKILKLTTKNNKSISLPIQGDGLSKRSFIYIDDFTDCLYLLLSKSKNRGIYNIGTSKEVTIQEIIAILSQITKTSISIKSTKSPDGSVTRRLPDVHKIKSLGFTPKISLKEGLIKTFLWYNDNQITA